MVRGSFLAGGRFTIAQACNRVVVRSPTPAATRMIGVLVLSMLKTIFSGCDLTNTLVKRSGRSLPTSHSQVRRSQDAQVMNVQHRMHPQAGPQQNYVPHENPINQEHEEAPSADQGLGPRPGPGPVPHQV